jgi:hypothetical protein
MKFVAVVFVLSVLIGFQNCAQFTPSSGLQSSPTEVSQAPPSPSRPMAKPSDCRFGGALLGTGQSIDAFLSSSGPAGGSCSSEKRICSEGVLSGSFAFPSCAVGVRSSCLFDGRQIPDGASVTGYLYSTPENGACLSETRVCNDGALSGSFEFAECSSAAAKKSCLFNGLQVFDGEVVKSFTNPVVPSGAQCVAETRVCQDGVLSGSSQNASCVVNAPSTCNFEGITVAHGGSVKAYLTAQPAKGVTCNSESRVCNNGTLSGANPARTCTETSFSDCKFGSVTVAHGQAVAAYPSPTDPATCRSESRTCSDGVLSGSNVYPTCRVTPELSCTFAGKIVASRTSVVAFKSENPPSGTACEQQTRTCNNGTLSGTYTAASCQDDPFAIACKTKPDATTYVGFKAYNSKLNEPCVYQVRTCSGGKASGSFAAVSCRACIDTDGRNKTIDSQGNPAEMCFDFFVGSSGVEAKVSGGRFQGLIPAAIVVLVKEP